jgi:hypothetical protein
MNKRHGVTPRNNDVCLTKVNLETFADEYLALKRQGVIDKDVCKIYFINLHDLYFIKKHLDLQQVRVRKKSNSLTEQELRKAMMNGIPRRVALRRKTELGWNNEDCINEPLKKGSRKIKIKMMLEERWK